MRPFSSPRMQVVRKEEKEARLNAFLTVQLAVFVAANSGSRSLSVIARGCDSPVLKALAAQARALADAGLQIRAVVVQTDAATACPDVAAFLAGVSCRFGCDSRLLDAHEQLVIGDQIAWIGDCMRREPMKRDAYECYSADCIETAAYAHRSFERVWNFARAGTAETGATTPAAPAAPAAVDLAMVAMADGETPPVVSTRH